MKSVLALLVLLWCLSGTVVRGQGEVLSDNRSDDDATLWKELMTLKEELSKANGKIAALNNEVSALQRENSERPKVAFYAGLGHSNKHVGPFNSDVTLAFKNVVTNIGQAYNRDTGVFRAPVRGIYYFRFTAMENRLYQVMALWLFHNSKWIVWNEGKKDDTGIVSMSHGVPLELQEGDVVYLKLPKGYGLFDDGGNYSSFSGFLIYPM